MAMFRIVGTMVSPFVYTIEADTPEDAEDVLNDISYTEIDFPEYYYDVQEVVELDEDGDEI